MPSAMDSLCYFITDLPAIKFRESLNSTGPEGPPEFNSLNATKLLKSLCFLEFRDMVDGIVM